MRLSLITRTVAVLSSVLLLQLTLLTSGTVCRMHAGDGAMTGAASGRSAHTRMTSRATSAGNTRSVADAPQEMPGGSCDVRGSCNAPSLPGGGCTSMSSCITAMSAMPAFGASAVTNTTRPVVILAAAAMPRGPASVPELPPPRL